MEANVDKVKILNMLQDFVLRVASDTDNKWPEEVAVLPAVATLLLESSYLLDVSQRSPCVNQP